MTPALQLMTSHHAMKLDDLVLKDVDPKADSRGGAYQRELLARWSENVHFGARKMIVENYLDRLHKSSRWTPTRTSIYASTV